MQLTHIGLAALATGAALVVAAAVAPRLLARSGRRPNSWVRLLAAVAGAALLCWPFVSLLRSRPPAHVAAVAAPLVHQAPVDLVDAASIALQDCPRAVQPSIPDGARATSAEMATARTAFQRYDEATNTYVHCVDQAIDRIRNQYAAVASSTELKALTAFGAGAHDTAIDQEQAVADQFNAQVRAYRAKHAKS